MPDPLLPVEPLPSSAPTPAEARRQRRDAAIAFSKTYAKTWSENSSTQSFWLDFYKIFFPGNERRPDFERRVPIPGQSMPHRIDVFDPGCLIVEQKTFEVKNDDISKPNAAGNKKNIKNAWEQLERYLPNISSDQRPVLRIVCNFQTFEILDIESGKTTRFALSDFHKFLDIFEHHFYRQAPAPADTQYEVSLKATKLLESISKQTEGVGLDPDRHAAWLTNLMFCLFGDDTSMWEPNLLHSVILNRTRNDGSDLQLHLNQFFKTLDTPESQRQLTPDYLKGISYVNGHLFSLHDTAPVGTAALRNEILAACDYDWSAVNPAIFGSLYQGVIDPAKRQQHGAEYTREQIILDILNPLIFDELEAQLANAHSKESLLDLQNRIANLQFLDPACGCGNFLITAYRQLRRLETRIIAKINTIDNNLTPLLVTQHTFRVNVNQFHGIEIDPFAIRIAETAMFMVAHLCDTECRQAGFGHFIPIFPIQHHPQIISANALRTDWSTMLDPTKEACIIGNPPYLGYSLFSNNQRADRSYVFNRTRSFNAPNQNKTDYAALWLRFAFQLMLDRSGPGQAPIRCGYITTNSIFQGQQANPVWQRALDRGIRINFARESFKWTSEAKNAAAVHCISFGFSRISGVLPRIYGPNNEVSTPADGNAYSISPYLTFTQRPYTLQLRSHPISPCLSPAIQGCRLGDFGHLTLTPEDSKRLAADPGIAPYIKELVSSESAITGKKRYCFYLANAPRDLLASNSIIRERLAEVRLKRLLSKRQETKKIAEASHLYLNDTVSHFISSPLVTGIPETVTFNRPYLTPVILNSNSIPGRIYFVNDPHKIAFSVISSTMFLAWQDQAGGKLKADYSFSSDLSYNNFPLPALVPEQITALTAASDTILEARGTTEPIRSLYAPGSMPPALLRAHQANDRIIDRIFGYTPDTSLDRAGQLRHRFLFLLEIHTRLTAE